MTWVTWRQHRGEAAAAVAVIALVGVYLLVTGMQMRAASAVLSDPRISQAAAMNDFMQRYLNLGMLTKYVLMVLPAILGVFVGAPLLAREIDQRTHLFAWAQSITRLRWFWFKIAVLSGGILMASAVLSLMASWWHSPLDQLFGEGQWIFFDAIGVAPLAYALFAFAAGVAVGTLVGRTVPAMAATVLLFAAARTAFNLLRPQYLPPVVKQVAFWQTMPQDALGIDLYWLDAANHRVPDERVTQLLQQAFPNQFPQATQIPAGSGGLVGSQPTPVSATQVAQMGQYLHEHGLRYLAVFQPGDRFWTFQLIEAGIFLVLAVMLFILSAWWLQKRLR